MQIELHRMKANHLYTEGKVLVNGLLTIPYAVEHTFSMLHTGEYLIRLTKDTKRRRVIGIYRPKGKGLEGIFESRHSYLSARDHHSIVIGEELIPGAVKRGSEHYDRLFDRIEKCEQREERVTFIISDEDCEESRPAAHWLQ